MGGQPYSDPSPTRKQARLFVCMHACRLDFPDLTLSQMQESIVVGKATGIAGRNKSPPREPTASCKCANPWRDIQKTFGRSLFLLPHSCLTAVMGHQHYPISYQRDWYEGAKTFQACIFTTKVLYKLKIVLSPFDTLLLSYCPLN